MRYRIFVYRAENGSQPDINAWVETFDANARGGRGFVGFTRIPNKALDFQDVKAALTFYRQVSTVQPTRDDGQPNRPLTAYTVTIEPVGELQKTVAEQINQDVGDWIAAEKKGRQGKP